MIRSTIFMICIYSFHLIYVVKYVEDIFMVHVIYRSQKKTFNLHKKNIILGFRKYLVGTYVARWSMVNGHLLVEDRKG